MKAIFVLKDCMRSTCTKSSTRTIAGSVVASDAVAAMNPENPAPHEFITLCMLLWCITASETKLVKPKTCLHSKSEL